MQQAAEAATEEDDDEEDDDIEELSDEDINTIAGIEPGKGEDEYDDGFGGDDDDEEGEEWKKADG